MRTWVPALAGVVAVAALAIALVALTDDGRSPWETAEYRFYGDNRDEATTSTGYDILDDEDVPSLGDAFVTTDVLYRLGDDGASREGERVGEASQVCVFTKADIPDEGDPDVRVQCTAVFTVDGLGDVSTSYVFEESDVAGDPPSYDLAVVGGTDRFAGASGEVTASNPIAEGEAADDTVYELRLRLPEGG